MCHLQSLHYAHLCFAYKIIRLGMAHSIQKCVWQYVRRAKEIQTDYTTLIVLITISGAGHSAIDVTLFLKINGRRIKFCSG